LWKKTKNEEENLYPKSQYFFVAALSAVKKIFYQRMAKLYDKEPYFQMKKSILKKIYFNSQVKKFNLHPGKVLYA
jgi:hypothetical protein